MYNNEKKTELSMVKFSFIALATVLATANAGSSARRRTIKPGDRFLRRGDPHTKALLQKARLHKRADGNATNTPRRLDDVEIDGSYNIKFSQCVDVKIQDEDLFDEDIIEYTQAGQIVAAKSYVIFHLCQGDDCYYDAEADLYIVDLATYLTNIATYHANKRNDYCEQCEEFENVCNVEEEEEDEDADEEDADEEEEADDEDADEEDEDADADEGDDADDEGADAEEDEEQEQEEEGQEEEGDQDNEDEGNQDEDNDEQEGEENQDEGDENQERKLKKNKRKLSKHKKLGVKAFTRKLAKQYIDCDQCQAYDCYEDEEDLDDNAVWRQELDEYVSEWIADLAECKESGIQWNGIDLYLGAMCSSYGDGVELAVFVNEDCTMYTSLSSFQNTWDPYNDNEDGMNYLTYAEEFIKYAFSEVTPCLEPEYADPNEAANDDQNDEDEDEEYEVNDYCQQVLEGDVIDFNNCGYENDDKKEDNDDENNWYTYDLKEADDIDEVCYTLNLMDGEYSYVYDEEASGTWYQRNKSGQITVENDTEKLSLSGGIIAAILCVCLIVLGGAVFLLKPKKKSSESNEPVYQGGTML